MQHSTIHTFYLIFCDFILFLSFSFSCENKVVVEALRLFRHFTSVTKGKLSFHPFLLAHTQFWFLLVLQFPENFISIAEQQILIFLLLLLLRLMLVLPAGARVCARAGMKNGNNIKNERKTKECWEKNKIESNGYCLIHT